VLVLTGDISVTARRRALELGARDFVTKPPDPVEILARVRNLLEMRHMQLQLELQNEQLSQRVAEQTRDIEQARQELLDRLALVSELRDYTTGEHTRRVGHTAELLARELLPLDDVRRAIRDAAPLHDIGKIAVPDSVLLKPGPLTDHETLLIRRHVEIGAQILGRSHSTVLRLAQEIALAHHERWDGTGYPSGRAGEEIPIAGRITAVADVFDALTHERPYKEALPVADAVRLIEHEAGRQFDPQVVAAFARLDHARLV
jgi:putative two-component system response regulator